MATRLQRSDCPSARPPAWRSHGFPDGALPPSHTQEMLLGKKLNVKMTARAHLSACDGPVTNRLLIFTWSSVTERIAWVETIKELLTCARSPSSLLTQFCSNKVARKMKKFSRVWGWRDSLTEDSRLSIIYSVGMQQMTSDGGGGNGGRSDAALGGKKREADRGKKCRAGP